MSRAVLVVAGCVATLCGAGAIFGMKVKTKRANAFVHRW